MNTGDDHCIAPEGLRAFRNESNNLCVRIRGRGEWEKVVVRVAFPYSDPAHYVVLFHDEQEIGVVSDLTDLDPHSGRLLKEMVAKRYHVPEVKRILAIEEAHNATRWDVETDMGQRSFEVQDRDNFRRVRGGGVVIIDVDTNRFRIPDVTALDKHSRKLMDMYY